VSDPHPDSDVRSSDHAVVLASLADGSSAPPANRPWSTRIAVLVVLAIVLGPILYGGFPHEVASWYAAAAVEHRLNGDWEAAFGLLDRALAWDGEDAAFYSLRADWTFARKDYRGCLDDCDRVLELKPTDSSALVQRTQALQRLGRHEEAIADWSRLVRMHQADSAPTRATTLNGLAYARAVGNRDLGQALQDVEQALPLVAPNAAMLDTRGFIHLLRGDLKKAQGDLDLAVAMVEEQLKDAQSATDYIDRRRYELALHQEQEGAAVIRYHRALLNEKLGRTEQAKADGLRVRELGFEPGPDLF
jgi:tetratricopeptide (TPR) repeat protein